MDDDQVERARHSDIRTIVKRLGIPSAKARNKYACPSADCGSSDAAHLYDDHILCYSCETSFDSIGVVMEANHCGFVDAVGWILSEDVATTDREQYEVTPDPDRPPSEVYDEHLLSLKPHAMSLMDLSKFGQWRGFSPEVVRHFSFVVDADVIVRSARNIEDFRRDGDRTVGDYGPPHWLPGQKYAVFRYQNIDGSTETIRYREWPDQSNDDIKTRSLRADRWAVTRPSMPYLGCRCAGDDVRTVYVVEGEIDAISVTLCDRWCVGAPGGHFRDGWAKRLGVDTAIIIGDGDDGGVGLVERAHTAFSSSGTATIRLQFPEGLDANDLWLDGNLDKFLTSIEERYL